MSSTISTYGNKKYCSFWRACVKGNECDKAFTPEIHAKILDWWRGSGSSVQDEPPLNLYRDPPEECFEARR